MKLVSTCAVIAIAWCCAAPAHAALADPALSLYQAMEIVTGTDMRERPRGFAMGLEDVLVKVSGNARLRSDARLAAVKKRARDYVVSFNYVDPIAGIRPHDDQGTYDRSQDLTISFNPKKIDALLVSLGDQPWRGPRPVLVPVLSVHGRKPSAYLLSIDEQSAAEQRAAFQRVADEAGLVVRFPAASEFGNGGIGDSTAEARLRCSQDSMIIVRGTLQWSDAAMGWVGTWRTCWKGATHEWAIRGVGYDQAFANIVQGVALLAAGRGEPEALIAR
jgi:hypothetical protein